MDDANFDSLTHESYYHEAIKRNNTYLKEIEDLKTRIEARKKDDQQFVASDKDH
ncbi:hypothetical protein ACH5RR_008439, partial [Cinchona calisaya]